MKTVFSVLILGLLMALTAPAAQQHTGAKAVNCSLNPAGEVLKLGDCTGLGNDLFATAVCILCIQNCRAQGLSDEMTDSCFVDCINEIYQLIGFKLAPRSYEIPAEQRGGVSMLSWKEIQ